RSKRDRLPQCRRLVREWDPGVHVEHVGTGLDLGECVALDPAEVADLHLLREDVATRRGDPLADDDERPVVADDDLARRRSDDGPGHAGSPWRVALEALPFEGAPGVSSWAGGRAG